MSSPIEAGVWPLPSGNRWESNGDEARIATLGCDDEGCVVAEEAAQLTVGAFRVTRSVKDSAAAARYAQGRCRPPLTAVIPASS